MILPFFCKAPYLLQIFRYVRIKNVLPEQSIESFYLGVQHRFPRLDMLYLNISFLAPIGETLLMYSCPLSVRRARDSPLLYIISSKAATTLSPLCENAGFTTSASRLKSPIMFNTWIFRPYSRLSCIKSRLQVLLMVMGCPMDCLTRAGSLCMHLHRCARFILR